MKIKQPFQVYILVIISTLGLSACSSAPSSGTYDRQQAGTIQYVKTGTVTGVREVTIENAETGIGSAAGGVIGGVAGSEVGKGRGRIVGSVLGAVLGGVVGSKIDRKAQTEKGTEVTVRLEDGNTVAISQLDDEKFKVGDYVKVITGGARARVTH